MNLGPKTRLCQRLCSVRLWPTLLLQRSAGFSALVQSLLQVQSRSTSGSAVVPYNLVQTNETLPRLHHLKLELRRALHRVPSMYNATHKPQQCISIELDSRQLTDVHSPTPREDPGVAQCRSNKTI